MSVNTEAKAVAVGFVTLTGGWAHEGRLHTLLSVAWFSLKAVFVKLAYGAHPVVPIALLSAWTLLGESLWLMQVAGLALVMFGITRLKPEQAHSVRTSDITKTSAGTARL